MIFIIKELQIRIGLILCYYVNKSIEIQEMKQLEENAVRPKKKSRKYSSFEEKLKEEEFVHMINKSEQLAMTYLHYNVTVEVVRLFQLRLMLVRRRQENR